MSSSMDETYYEILKVDRGATISEIVAAYHKARNAFSTDSVATYSLFSADEANEILDRLDQAYQTLSNIERKHDYDQLLQIRESGGEPSEQMGALDRRKNPQRDRRTPIVADPPAGPSERTPKSSSKVEFTPLPETYHGWVSGEVLKTIREHRGVSVEELARVTKIPSKYIKAIELEDKDRLPARVYLQGFVKNIATFLKLEPQLVAQSYLDHIQPSA